MRDWGLSNVHEQRFPFGRGWSLEVFHAHMTEPQIMPLIGYPRGVESEHGRDRDRRRWSGVDIRSQQDLERYRGRLRGVVVLPQPVRDVRMLEGDLVLRMDDELLAESERPAGAPAAPRRSVARRSFADVVERFYVEEGVVAVLDRGSDAVMVGGAPSGSGLAWPTQRADGGTVFVGRGGSWVPDAEERVPSATIAVEHYNRMVRLLGRGVPVRVRLNITTRFHDEPPGLNGFNVFGEIPGTDLRDEVVLLGAHFDSTHAATGANRQRQWIGSHDGGACAFCRRSGPSLVEP